MCIKEYKNYIVSHCPALRALLIECLVRKCVGNGVELPKYMFNQYHASQIFEAPHSGPYRFQEAVVLLSDMPTCLQPAWRPVCCRLGNNSALFRPSPRASGRRGDRGIPQHCCYQYRAIYQRPYQLYSGACGSRRSKHTPKMMCMPRHCPASASFLVPSLLHRCGTDGILDEALVARFDPSVVAPLSA